MHPWSILRDQETVLRRLFVDVAFLVYPVSALVSYRFCEFGLNILAENLPHSAAPSGVSAILRHCIGSEHHSTTNNGHIACSFQKLRLAISEHQVYG